MREYIVKFETDTPLSEIAAGSMVRAIIKTVGDCDEVIRCKDCKYRNAENGFCEGRGWPMQLVPDDGFCNYAERKEE